MYGLSSNMLSFWLNPSNLRRWGKQKTADCPLCKWKNCTLQHILCGCKVALEQGRISWRHDSILMNIVRYIKQSMVQRRKEIPQETSRIKFLKKGTRPPKKSRRKSTFWDGTDDWKILVDTRQTQYQIPPDIAASSQRPDICIYSKVSKKVCFIELTSPIEENMKLWKLKKRTKYMDLIESAK